MGLAEQVRIPHGLPRSGRAQEKSWALFNLRPFRWSGLQTLSIALLANDYSPVALRAAKGRSLPTTLERMR